MLAAQGRRDQRHRLRGHRNGLGDDRRLNGDLWQPDRPLGNDLDARRDQRGELRRSAAGRYRQPSARGTASINRSAYMSRTPAPLRQPAIGSSASPIASADIGGTCTMNGTPRACDSGRGVCATTVGGAPPTLVKPQIDLDWWWKNAKPGPKHPCTEPGNTFPNTFDNDAGDDEQRPTTASKRTRPRSRR